MPNLLPDGGMESGLATLAGLAERVTSQAFEGTHSLLLRTRKGFSPGTSSCTWPPFTQTVGRTYSLTFRYDGDGSVSAPLHIDVDDGLGSFVNAANLAAPGAGAWAVAEPVTWEAQGVSGRVRMRSGNAVPAIANDVWYIDAVEVELEEVIEGAVISRQIREALVADLQSITAANGYSLTLSAIYTNPTRNLAPPFAMLAAGEGGQGDVDEATNRSSQCEQRYIVRLGVRTPTAYDDLLGLLDDVRNAVEKSDSAVQSLPFVSDASVSEWDPAQGVEADTEMWTQDLVVLVLYHYERGEA